MQINAVRVNDRLAYLTRFGTTPDGGVTRYALSREEKAATDTVARWMEEAGLQVRRDAVGNLFGRLPGRRPGPAVLTGSHLDSVPNGGHYDGPAGVLAALEAVQSMREQGLVPELPIEVASFIGEEGSRFPHGLMGSSFLTGTFPYDEISHLKDRDGITLDEALRAYGSDPERAREAAVAPGAYKAYVELHIEQSGMLEARGLPAGIVSGIAGMRQARGIIRGRAEHAGACPMDLRRDPMPAAAEVILEVERAARESDPATRATVGFIKAMPGGTNVIPAAVELSFDIRDLDGARRDACVERVKAFFLQVCHRRSLTAEFEIQHTSTPIRCDSGIVQTMTEAAGGVGMEPFQLPSGAVHDGANVSLVCPVGMIFVRSRDGLSHCPQEYTSPEDIAVGTRLLAETLRRLAG
ncbi:MAG TPA: Zn-dependent hydrolase [Symbiobacteriaceae bacterium]|nr:Zn-dependent hydrolase [Symbiobacteriaceae bacterium]